MKKSDLKLAALGAATFLGLGALNLARADANVEVELAPWALGMEAAQPAAPQGVVVSFAAVAVAPLEGPDGTPIGTAPPDVSPILP